VRRRIHDANSRARFAESAEAIAALADLPYRAARRLDNNPATLSSLAAEAISLRDRIRRSREWMSSRHPTLAGLYAGSVEIVEEHVQATLQEAWKPSEQWGPDRTASGEFDTPMQVTEAVRLWSRARRWHRAPDVVVRSMKSGPLRWSAIGRLAAKLGR
jgi:hypothetical protein